MSGAGKRRNDALFSGISEVMRCASKPDVEERDPISRNLEKCNEQSQGQLVAGVG
jgi:hypothetical protein